MVIADFEEELDNGSGAPGRLMRVTGARGIGKTVMLAEFNRMQLIEAQVIEEKGCNKVDFAIPYLREYLREHAAYIRMTLGMPE